MKFLKKFNTHAEYEEYRADYDFIKPNVTKCISPKEVHYNPLDYRYEYLTLVPLENGSFKFTSRTNQTVDYSTNNGRTWSTLESDVYTEEINAGTKVIWRANLSASTSAGSGTFSSTCDFNVKGNILSMAFGDDFTDKTDLTGKNHVFTDLFKESNAINAYGLQLVADVLPIDCYRGLFFHCRKLKKGVKKLPAKTLGERCYHGMFGGCTSLITPPISIGDSGTTMARSACTDMFMDCVSLTKAPKLPITKAIHSCYYQMFYGCTSLINAPELPATILDTNSYGKMFYGCTSLITAPTLPAERLENSCYKDMFYGCTSLANTPDMMATSMVGNYACAGMFQNCTNLVTAFITLPITSLKEGAYDGMFNGCTNLTNAPFLPANNIPSNGYRNMFKNCSILNYIECLATSIGDDNRTLNWVQGVAENGTFVKATTADWSGKSEGSGIPNGWTVEEKEPLRNLIIEEEEPDEYNDESDDEDGELT